MTATVTPMLDARVRKVLKGEPTPFFILQQKLPDVEAGEIREALLRLNAHGVADIAYGRGWHLRA